MRTAIVSAAAGLALAAGLFADSAISGAFWPGKVVNVAYNDVLNVRRWPSPSSRIIASYRNGDHVSMTGKCRSVSGSWSVDLNDASGRAQFRAWVKRHWCEVYHPDAGTGWVRGKFLRVL